MDRKELKDKIDELRSTARMEIACTIREIMYEHGIIRKELKRPVECSDGLFEAALIETDGEDTAIPTITQRMMSCKRAVKRVSPMDFEMDFESLASIAYELNDEPESYFSVKNGKDDGLYYKLLVSLPLVTKILEL